ncbi:MAG: hypothetical protein ACD_75C00309G0005 [uncultured bacterium]|nr:MAG: hypothetical protein ACD_75C00309G0005 [uncultured bacterium]
MLFNLVFFKDSLGAIARFAAQTKYSRTYISLHIHGHRRNEKLLQEMANHLGCGVYSVMPNRLKIGPNRPERKEETE